MTNLNQAVVVLTGAVGGFGQQFTRQLLKAGGRLMLTDLDEAMLHEQVTTIQSEITTGDVVTCWAIDLSKGDGCETLYKRVKAIDTPIDILINNNLLLT